MGLVMGCRLTWRSILGSERDREGWVEVGVSGKVWQCVSDLARLIL